MFEYLKRLLRPRCCSCGKKIDTRKMKEGIGGGFSDAGCWKCIGKMLRSRGDP